MRLRSATFRPFRNDPTTRLLKKGTRERPVQGNPVSTRLLSLKSARSVAVSPNQSNSSPSASTTSSLPPLISVINSILDSKTVVEEKEVLVALKECEAVANALAGRLKAVYPRGRSISSSSATTSTPSQTLLSLDETSSHSAPPPTSSPSEEAFGIAVLVQALLEHPPIFITPDILSTSTKLLIALNRPHFLPTLFELYSHKSLPQQASPSSPIKYIRPSPNSPSNAIPSPLASLALSAFLRPPNKSLSHALSVILTTYCTPSYNRSLLIRRALLPFTAAVLAPIAAYVTASKVALYQTAMDPTQFSQIAFVGILAYLGFTSVIGLVALTTSNDQMKRVTWANGMPLRERWLREDERAAIDRVASAWGLSENARQGEEEGSEWEELRSWIGRRGMVLDRVELMEGME